LAPPAASAAGLGTAVLVTTVRVTEALPPGSRTKNPSLSRFKRHAISSARSSSLRVAFTSVTTGAIAEAAGLAPPAAAPDPAVFACREDDDKSV